MQRASVRLFCLPDHHRVTPVIITFRVLLPMRLVWVWSFDMQGVVYPRIIKQIAQTLMQLDVKEVLDRTEACPKTWSKSGAAIREAPML